MGVGDVLQLTSQFGQMGLFVVYLVWRELRDEKARSSTLVGRKDRTNSHL